MADYTLQYPGATIDALLGKVNNPDATPTANSENLVKSDGVKSYVDGKTGDLSQLKTTAKTNLVAAINEESANRTYNALQPNGMGYKILRTDATFASQVTDTNTIYEIRYPFDLNNATVTIPSGCVLQFNGGKLSNGTINADNSVVISAGKEKIFNNISFTGRIREVVFKIEWFVDVYLNEIPSSTSLCAASQIEEALGCGIYRLTIGGGRFYPLQRTISYTGATSIYEEQYINGRNISTRDRRAKQPCIFSNNVVTLLDYNFLSDTIAGITRTQSLTLRGIQFYCNKSFTDLTDKSVPIVKVTAKGDLWGLQMDCNISAIDCPIVVNDVNSGHYIASSQVDTAYLVNYTGIKLITDGGFMTNVKVSGNIENVYYGITSQRGANSGDWMTALDLSANTICYIGANLGTDFSPLVVTGQHQVKRCEAQNNEAYMNCHNISMQGFIYDLGVGSNGIFPVGKALHLVDDSASEASWATGNQLDSAEYDNKIVTNDFIPIFAFENLLKNALNSNEHPIFSNGGYVTYQVKSGTDALSNIFTYNDGNTYFNVYNAPLAFGDRSMFLAGATGNSIQNSTKPGIVVKSAHRGKTLDFVISMKGNITNVANYENGIPMALSFLNNVHSNVVVSIKNATSNTYIVQDKGIGTARLWRYKTQVFTLPYNFEVTITFSIATSSSKYQFPLPIVFIPNIFTDFTYYEGWYSPAIFNGSGKYLFRSLQTGFANRLFFVYNKNAYDMDGFKMNRKKGTTAQRPSSPDEGYQYYDTDLKKYILWNGTSWVNIDGTAL